MDPVQLDFPFLNKYLEVRDKYYNLGDIMKDSEVERWMRTYFYIDDPQNAENAMDEILTALSNNNQSKQMRHYIAALCSLKDENIVAFCEALLPNYFVFSILAMIKSKFEPAMDKQAHKFNKKLSSWSRHLGKRVE